MNNKFDSKNECSKYAWNEAMILDKIQEILDGKNIDELDILILNPKALKIFHMFHRIFYSSF